MHFFLALVDSTKFGERVWMRIGPEKTYEQFAGIDIAALGEGISRNNVAHFGGRAVNHAGAEAEFKFNSFFDALGEDGEVAIARAENDVAAIDIGLAAGEFQRFVERAKGVHFDLIAADDVDAAKQGNDGWHGAEYTTKDRSRGHTGCFITLDVMRNLHLRLSGDCQLPGQAHERFRRGEVGKSLLWI